MRGRGLLVAAVLCAGCLSAVAGQALFVREESLAQLRDTRSTSAQTGDFGNNNHNNNLNNNNHSGRSGRSGANAGGRRTSQRRAPPPPQDAFQQQRPQQDRSSQPPWDQGQPRRRPSQDARDARDAANVEEQDFLKTSQSQYPRQQYNQQFNNNNNNNNFNQKASQYQKPQTHVFQKTTGKSNDFNDLNNNDQSNGQGQFGQNNFNQQHNNQFNNNNFNRQHPTGGGQFGSSNQFGNQQDSNANHDGRVSSQPRGSNFNTDGRTPTHFESARSQFRQGRQFQNGSNQKPQQNQSSFRQEQDQSSFRQQQTQQTFAQQQNQPYNQQTNQQSFRQQQTQQPLKQQQQQQQFTQESSQQSFRHEQSFRQEQTHQPVRHDQSHANNFNGINNNNNQGSNNNNNNNFYSNNFQQRPNAVSRNRTPQQNPTFNSFNSVSNNFQKIRIHNTDDNDIHRLSPTTPPNNNNYVIFPTGGDDQAGFNNNIQQPLQRLPTSQQGQQRTPAPLTGQRQVQPQSDAGPTSRATRVPSQPQATVSIDQTVQSILNWIQGMSRSQERRARQQGVGQPSRQYLPVPEATERPRPFQPAASPPTEPARQGVTPPSREYLPVPESPAGPGGPEGPGGPAGPGEPGAPGAPATEAPRPFETPAPEAPTTGPADTPAGDTPGGPEPEAPEGPEPVNIPIPETPSPELETPSAPAPTEPAPGPEAPATEAPFTEAPATPAPEAPEAGTPAAPQETPAPDTAAPEGPTEAPATFAPEAPTEGPAPEAPEETPGPEAPAETPAPEVQTDAPTPAPDAPAGPDEPAAGEPGADGPGTTAAPGEDGLHPPHIHAIDVQCAKDMMTITIEFDKPYDGIIYSKGFFKDPNCRYVQPNSNQIKYTFTVMLNSCGTQFVDDFQGGSGQAYLENVIVLQNEEGIQEVWDSIRSVRCLWEGNLKQALTVALSVGNLNQEIVTFGGDTGMAKLDIQVGRGPFAPAANGLVKIGEMMTLVVSVEGDPGFDVQVRACVARDADSTNLVQLTDGDGCVLKPKLLGAFQKTKETGNTGASIIAYAFFQAFKFPDVMDLIIECSVDLCKTDCEMCPNPNQKLEPGAKRRRRRDVWSSGNATQQREAGLDSEGLVGDDLGVIMGRRLRVFTPDELPVDVILEGGTAASLLQQQQETYGDNVIHVPADASRGADGVCLSLPSLAASSALALSLLTASSVLSATLWLKLQQARLGGLGKQRAL